MTESENSFTPELAPDIAAEIVESAQEISRVTLDYSVESLQLVDDIIDEFHREKLDFDDMAETLYAFGCYVGEVFVRNAGATWRASTQDELENVFGVPLILEMKASNSLVNPIGKVIKRMENGDEDNLPYFYRAFTK